MNKTPARVLAACVLIVGGTAVLTRSAQDRTWIPAQFAEGMLPVTPVQAVAGGEVFVEATVSDTGVVDEVVALRTSPPFTAYVLDAVRNWRFQPAKQTTFKTPGDAGSAVTDVVESQVLIACVFRPPTLNAPTLGEPPKDAAIATDDVAFPVSTITPLYPPLARAEGTVLVEVRVGVNGSVRSATIVRSAPGFDESAMDAARQWVFRPVRMGGRLEETFAYIVFAFRSVVTPSPVPPIPRR